MLGYLRTQMDCCIVGYVFASVDCRLDTSRKLRYGRIHKYQEAKTHPNPDFVKSRLLTFDSDSFERLSLLGSCRRALMTSRRKMQSKVFCMTFPFCSLPVTNEL